MLLLERMIQNLIGGMYYWDDIQELLNAYVTICKQVLGKVDNVGRINPHQRG